MEVCVACGVAAAHSCGRCGALYCSRTCQVAAWPTHKGACKRPKDTQPDAKPLAEATPTHDSVRALPASDYTVVRVDEDGTLLLHSRQSMLNALRSKGRIAELRREGRSLADMSRVWVVAPTDRASGDPVSVGDVLLGCVVWWSGPDRVPHFIEAFRETHDNVTYTYMDAQAVRSRAW